MTYEAIPHEMRSFRQWIVWRLEWHQDDTTHERAPTKIPYTVSGFKASVTNPSSWNSFEVVTAAQFGCIVPCEWNAPVTQTGFSGIGFVLTENDPYGFIDLDNIQKETDPAQALKYQLGIFHAFDSYSERSPSGNGLHIIIRGKLKAGHRRGSIEIYSSGRYMTMTGDVFENKTSIKERQELFTTLSEEMGTPAIVPVHTGDVPQAYSDEEIVSRGLNAANGNKFKKLHEGNFEDYPSQSEADFAYVDIISFYTQNRAQIKRIFTTSPLGARNKKTTINGVAYLDHMINRSFDRLLPPIDFDGLYNQLELGLMEKKAAAAMLSAEGPAIENAAAKSQGGEPIQEVLPGTLRDVKPHHLLSRPPGLLGELASFVYASAARPVPEMALATAIGLMAGITGRAYNVSGTGLNQYILMLAPTGTGKEGMSSGIDKLMLSIKLAVPASSSFIGPGFIASGQALLKYLSKTSNCFLCVLSEFGGTLAQLSSAKANPAQAMLLNMLRDLYHKSDHGATLRPSVYSQKENDTETVLSPAMSILGETNPDEFYRNVDESMISSGLLPRFTIIEYSGITVELNENRLQTPSMPLTERLAQLAAEAHRLMHFSTVTNVQFSEEAQMLSKELGRFCDKQKNEASGEVVRHLWNRVHLKTMKLAAVLAVGQNFYAPVIQASDFEWAQSLVTSSTWGMLRRFERGEIGRDSEESKQSSEIIRVIREYVEGDETSAVKYGAPSSMWAFKIIPYAYIQRRLVASAAFRLDKYGSTNAIKRTIQTLLDSDVIREIGKNELATKYGTTMRGFVVSNPAQVLAI